LSLFSIFEAKADFLILGLLFDISKTKANDTFNYWLDILRYLTSLQMEEVRENREQYEKLRNLLTEYQLIVDSTEQPTARPVDYESRKILLGQEKDAHFKKSVYCFTTRSRH